MIARRRLLWLAWLAPGAASAHSFGRVYNLPLPLWMYVYGSAAALLLSFLVAAWFLGAQPPPARVRALRVPVWLLRLRLPLRLLALFCLLLSIASGLLGADNPYSNINMTLFWVGFVLVYAYFTALVGDAYLALNPWRTLVLGLRKAWPGYARGRLAYPARLAYWPALGLYLGFIWIELFAYTRPHSLALILAAYTLLNLGGAWLVGEAAWFRHCEFFGLFLHLLGKLAPLDYRPGGAAPLRLRPPLAGVLEQDAGDASELVFVLAMLATTAFDGLHETTSWMRWFWVDLYRWLMPWLGDNPFVAYPKLAPWYLAWCSLCLVAVPFLYAGAYRLCIRAAGALGKGPPARVLVLRFAYTLLPIVLVYNLTHYFTLVLAQGPKLVSLVSDPLGRGWNLFGTAWWLKSPLIPDAGTVWHAQVALIVAGHVASVYLAHVQALRSFPSARRAALSQLPVLLLMILFTALGLWILAQPVKAGV